MASEIIISVHRHLKYDSSGQTGLYFQTTYKRGLNLIWDSTRCVATCNVITAHNEIRDVIKPHFNVYDVIKKNLKT